MDSLFIKESSHLFDTCIANYFLVCHSTLVCYFFFLCYMVNFKEIGVNFINLFLNSDIVK